jgi:hypothetical protein
MSFRPQGGILPDASLLTIFRVDFSASGLEMTCPSLTF